MHGFCGVVGAQVLRSPASSNRLRAAFPWAPGGELKCGELSSFISGAAERTSDANGITALVRARLDGAETLAELLGITKATNGELVLAAYERWGIDFAHHLDGGFAIALWDAAKRRVVLASDRLGLREVFFSLHPTEGIGFATHPTPLRLFLGGEPELDSAVIARYLAGLPIPHSSTSFRGIERVAPGHVVTIEERVIRRIRYWSPDDLKPVRLRRAADYAEAFRERLENSVARCLRGSEASALAASAGLDSSSILAAAVRLGHAHRITPVSVVPEEPSCNEQSEVVALCEPWGLEPVFLDPVSTLDGLRTVALAAGEPGHLEFFPIFGRLARSHEVITRGRILTGLHGDVVGSAIGGLLPTLFRESPRHWQKQLGRLPFRQRTRATAISLLRSFPPTDAWIRARSVCRAMKRWQGRLLLSPEALRAHDLLGSLENLLARSARGASDAHFARRELVAQNIPSQTDFIGRMFALSGIEDAHPFADLGLLALSLGVPLELLRDENGLNRGVQRAAARDLPDFVRLKRRKVRFNHMYVRIFRELSRELDQPLHPELASLVSVPRIRALQARSSPTFPEAAALWRCLAVNYWLRDATGWSTIHV